MNEGIRRGDVKFGTKKNSSTPCRQCMKEFPDPGELADHMISAHAVSNSAIVENGAYQPSKDYDEQT